MENFYGLPDQTGTSGLGSSGALGRMGGMRFLLLVTVALGLGHRAVMAQTPELKRMPWTASHIHGSPEPPKPFVAQRIFPQAKFDQPTEIAFDAVSGRWLVLEQHGEIWSLDARDPKATPELCADLRAKYPDLDYLYGFAFHPHHTENGYVFITYTRGPNVPDGTKLSRFVMKREPGKGPHLDLDSEKVVLTWLSGGHNGANLHFGLDGMLYISTGDSADPSPPDIRNTGQDISDLLSSILRIDVDHEAPGLAYAIPKDNPFLGKMVDTAEHKLKPARGEVWAYGVRNPWKMSFDPATGRLWCADVGWELWESVDLIKKGGNYGWSAMEASQPARTDTPKGPTPISPPIVAHSHDEAASITGGYVYHGKKFPELESAYIYGDWVTGKIWALWYDGKQVTRHDEIADTHHKIVAFGQDAAGEIIYADYNEQAGLYQLERNPSTSHAEKFPTRLSETGLFKVKDGKVGGPEDGVYEFEISKRMSDDGAWSRHYVALPNKEGIHTTVKSGAATNGPTTAEYEAKWPKDSVLAKTLFFEMIQPQSIPEDLLRGTPPPPHIIRKIETQILHYDGQAWNAYSYRWNEEGTDAELVPAAGAEETLTIKNLPPKRRRHFSSRAECLRCHNLWTGYALGFHPTQMAGLKWTPTAETPGVWNFHDQTDVMQNLGLFDTAFMDQSNARLAKSIRMTDPNFLKSLPWTPPIADSARAYLHANCSHCHRQNSGGAVNMFLNAELLLGQTRTVGVTPQQGGLGLEKPKLIDPGNPWNSVICVRVAKIGAGHMPIIGPHEVDFGGLSILEDWIARMDGKSRSADDLLPKTWTEEKVHERLRTVEGAMQMLRAKMDNLIPHDMQALMLETAWHSPNQTVRDLFESFKPEDQREKTLGTNVDSNTLLKMKGDAARGAKVLSIQGKLGACFACHFINGTGKDFGPDLSHVGARLTKAQILESILQPSKVIAPGFAAVVVEMKDGSAQTGFVVKEDEQTVTVKIATGQSVPLKKTDLAKRTMLPNSLMPEGLLQSLTTQEAADVAEYLSSLK